MESGEKELIEIVKRRGDTAEVHPWFDSIAETVATLIDQKLSKAGWATPLADPIDVTIEDDAIGLMIGKLTRGFDGRAPWMDNIESAANAHLEMISAGDVPIIGAEPEDDPTQALLMEGAFEDEQIFDQSNPMSPVHRVFGSLRVR